MGRPVKPLLAPRSLCLAPHRGTLPPRLPARHRPPCACRSVDNTVLAPSPPRLHTRRIGLVPIRLVFQLIPCLSASCRPLTPSPPAAASEGRGRRSGPADL